ncbi:endonuclease domain-containing protein [Hyphomicrobium sp.]|jgi:very-short-patch-repair endonuclease|uniref:endonuclease domain-containing protein n=1 Tax=Hyphomicrobium sp. TaxID=82 RepID=UPI002CF13CE8|nr:endonuclease domain-containing protein [Hyphomicrobium sp.]HVZ03287.1 endonuclease domain-containing protein [Hyphomicrobium sp.]
MVSEIARKLRKAPTSAEKKLWSELRKLRSQGYHFRRQHPVEGFIVDFACLSQKLIIEVDGAQHQLTENAKADAARDDRLSWRGYRVLRFGNGLIRENLDGVLLEILAVLGAVAKNE